MIEIDNRWTNKDKRNKALIDYLQGHTAQSPLKYRSYFRFIN